MLTHVQHMTNTTHTEPSAASPMLIPCLSHNMPIQACPVDMPMFTSYTAQSMPVKPHT